VCFTSIFSVMAGWIAEILFMVFFAYMGNIRNVVFFRFRDVTKQNGCASVGALYREPLGEILVHYKNVYKIKKWSR